MSTPARREREEELSLIHMPGYTGKLDESIRERIAVLAPAIGVPDLVLRFPHLGRANWRTRKVETEPARCIDHTVLRPEASSAQIAKLCDEAVAHNFAAVCVNGSRVAQCVGRLKGTPVKVAAVIGFPLGAGTTAAKAFEARELVEGGAAEIDMVLNVGKLKEADYAAVYADICAVVAAARPGIVKVIFEICLLTHTEILDAAILSVAAGAQFIKTSTGFDKGGATPEAVDAMLAVAGNESEVKASGGVRDYPTAIAYMRAGVTRIGTSSGIAIVGGKLSAAGAY
jgi:deoxyribose-phosphate aldolase